MSSSFAELFEESLKTIEMHTGSIITGVIIDIDKDWVTVHTGLKSEGVIPKEDILQAYDFVMSREPDNRHNFLFLDLTPKKEHPSPFRMNYDTWLIP